MKFSDINETEWTDLQPYLDTCLLPVTGLTGMEQPWQATEALEQLRDALELIEIPYKGRVVTYPALHYLEGVDMAEQVNKLSSRLKSAGFTYVVVLTVHKSSLEWEKRNVDEIFYVDMGNWSTRKNEFKAEISVQLQHIWTSSNIVSS
ncbi:DUF2487 family protein [Paenibacillus eucommiae]|uniref:DUF2487 family protein n=1 Tax=Paenibacillus eucommiae TaxID=1355755 RepID=A0ABS4J626_9BACL|nr:DUF2487 family protein [Paenibacillus eucommiae]MBP1994750.1 hypothetical protein [Paenibacillus eucommiae]